MNPHIRQQQNKINPKLNSPKLHKCPNCHCHSYQTLILTKPINTNFNQRISSSPQTSPYQSHPYHCQQTRFNKQINNNFNRVSENIYYHKNDRSNSPISANSNKSYISIKSNQLSGANVITLPKKAINVSFRYLSPSKQQNKNDKQINSIKENKTIQNNNFTYKNYKQSLYQTKIFKPKQINTPNNYNIFNQYTQQQHKYEINQPKIPNILKKKSGQKKLIKSKSINQFTHTQQKQLKISKINTTNNNRILNLINYQQSTPTIQYDLKTPPWNTPHNFDLALEEERTIANQLLRDLKLNYDYYETADISKYSNNAS